MQFLVWIYHLPKVEGLVLQFRRLLRLQVVKHTTVLLLMVMLQGLPYKMVILRSVLKMEVVVIVMLLLLQAFLMTQVTQLLV